MLRLNLEVTKASKSGRIHLVQIGELQIIKTSQFPSALSDYVADGWIQEIEQEKGRTIGGTITNFHRSRGALALVAEALASLGLLQDWVRKDSTRASSQEESPEGNQEEESQEEKWSEPQDQPPAG